MTLHNAPDNRVIDLAESIFTGAPTISLEMGVALFHPGDRAATVFRVISGGLRLTRTAENGQAATLHNANRGEIIAEAAVFSQFYQCECRAPLRGFAL